MGEYNNLMANNNVSKMGDPKQTVWQEIVNFIPKLLIWAAYITLAVVAKIAFDSRFVKLSAKQIAIKIILSVFVGVLAAILCETLHWNTWGKVIVPVSTLIGEGIVGYIISNWEKVANLFLSIFIKSKS